MKTINFFLLALVLTGTTMLQSCNKDDDKEEQSTQVVPTNFYVDIPDAISQPASSKSKGDSLSGNDIYSNLTTFIAVGEGAAQMVNGIIYGITKYDIDEAMNFTYTSSEDNRMKRIVVKENQVYEGVTYEFGLTISDELSASQADSGKGLQVFWSRKPIKGIAIVKPINCNRIGDAHLQNAMFRIDYSEAGEHGYEKEMTVSISNIPTTGGDQYAINNLKMFAGRNGDVVDVYGNSNHPKAKFLTGTTGFNWAFVATANETYNTGVAEVGLPLASIDDTSRATLLETHSVKNVLTSEINTAMPGLSPSLVAAYLYNTNSPGYFNKAGFVQAGVAPTANHTALAPRIKSLKPFSPKLISDLNVQFAK